MITRTTIKRSAISGAVWAVFALLLMMLLTGSLERGGRWVWGLRGGILFAPLIGVAAGFCSGAFRQAGFVGRILLAVVTVYGAVFLYLLSGIGMAMAVGESVRMPLTRVVFESAAGAMAGLTWTGLWVVLVPAAYLNHLIVSRPELASVAPDKKSAG